MKLCRKQLHTYSNSLKRCPNCYNSKKRIYNRIWRTRNKERFELTTKLYQEKNKERITLVAKNWRQTNQHKRRFLKAQRRAKQLLATPIWANIDKIKSIYSNCPEGYEVDHIIPLQSKNVSGLHVENNLQYLIPIDNRIKSNKLVIL